MNHWFFLFSIVSCSVLNGQNTIGLVDYKPWLNSYEGLNLLYPHYQPNAYLIDNCGRIINQWNGEDGVKPGNVAYLTDEGNLLVTKRKDDGFAFIYEVSGEAKVECRTWDNELLWSFNYVNEDGRMHHDIELTPYGTVLIIAWDHHSVEDALAMGRDENFLEQEAFCPDKIMEYDPSIDSVIWEWKAWDHLIQDKDADLPNFGIISENPHRININWENNHNRADWMHVNSIDYHPELDQILINVPMFNEIWIIDHSTSTEEAKGSTGGKSGKGGDLLWRWGNPMAYNRGTETDQQLFFQHDANWVLDHLNEVDHGSYNKISVFNNEFDEEHSQVCILNPVFDTSIWSYAINANNHYLPESFDYIWTHPEPDVIKSRNLSSVQVLANNHLLVCSGNNGHTIELDQDENIVWEYITPFRNTVPVSQGTQLQNLDNPTFRLKRYPLDYPGFEGKDLFPGDYIELDPNPLFCEKALNNKNQFEIEFKIFPIPSSDLLNYESSKAIKQLEIFNLKGKILKQYDHLHSKGTIDISTLESGYYFLRINNHYYSSFIKM